MESIKNHFIRASVYVRSSNVFIEGFAKSFDADESKRDVKRGREKRLRAENSAMAKTSLRSKDDAKSEAKNTYWYDGLTVRSLALFSVDIHNIIWHSTSSFPFACFIIWLDDLRAKDHPTKKRIKELLLFSG